jgi:hypothetical protein
MELAFLKERDPHPTDVIIRRKQRSRTPVRRVTHEAQNKNAHAELEAEYIMDLPASPLLIRVTLSMALRNTTWTWHVSRELHGQQHQCNQRVQEIYNNMVEIGTNVRDLSYSVACEVRQRPRPSFLQQLRGPVMDEVAAALEDVHRPDWTRRCGASTSKQAYPPLPQPGRSSRRTSQSRASELGLYSERPPSPVDFR